MINLENATERIKEYLTKLLVSEALVVTAFFGANLKTDKL